MDDQTGTQVGTQEKQSRFSLPFTKMKFQNGLSLYYLTFCFAFIFMVILYPIPAPNKDIVNVITGVVVTTGLGTVLQFWLGSSKSSSDKDETINKAMNK